MNIISTRPNWHKFFMDIAIKCTTRSTCMSRQTGAVLVRDNRMLASGYNGASAGSKHCAQLGCLRKDIESGAQLDRCRAVHAEENCLMSAAKYGISTDNASLYATNKPCYICLKSLINAGIANVYYLNDYPSDLVDNAVIENDSIRLICIDYLYANDKICDTQYKYNNVIKDYANYITDDATTSTEEAIMYLYAVAMKYPETTFRNIRELNTILDSSLDRYSQNMSADDLLIDFCRLFIVPTTKNLENME